MPAVSFFMSFPWTRQHVELLIGHSNAGASGLDRAQISYPSV